MGNSLSKDFITYGFGNILYTAANLLLLPIFLEKLEVNEYGVLSVFLVSSSLVTNLFSLNIPNGILRSFNEGYGAEKEKKWVSTAFLYFIIVGLFFVFIAYIFKSKLSQLIFGNQNYNQYILLFVILGFSRILDSLNLGVLRARNKSKKYVLLNIINVIYLAAINIYIIYFTEFALINILWGYIISGLISNCTGLIFNYFEYKWKFEFEGVKYFFRYGFPLSIASCISYFINYGNRYFLMNYSTKTDVALIDISQKIASLVGILLTVAFLTVFTPYYLNLYSKVSFFEFSKKINKLIIDFSVFFCFMGLCIIMFQDLGLSLLSNHQYLSVVQYVPYLILSNYLNVLFSMLTMGTNILKRTEIEMYITIFIFSISIIGNIILIQYYGIYGAIITQLLINLLSVLIISVYNKQKFPVKIDFKSIIKLIFVFVVLCFAKFKIPMIFNMNNLIIIRVFIPLILVAIFILLYHKVFLALRSTLFELGRKK